jgi:hypothetical protein
MTENFRQNYINTVAAALVAALPTGKRTKQPAAALDAEDEDDVVVQGDRNPNYGKIDRGLVNNVLIAQLMQRQREVEAKQL